MVHLWMGLHGEYRIPESLVDEAKLAVMPHGWETSRLKAWVAEQEWKALNG